LVADIIHTATGGNVTFTYGHDNSGLITNLTVSDDLFAPFTDIAGTKSFSPNSLNQYTSAMGEAIVHDGNGNLSSDGANDYVHDAVNRLITATVGSTTWTYAYGPLDRRMSKTDGTNIFQYLYDNDRAVAEYNGTGTLLRKYIYGPGLDEPIMMIVPGDPNETVYYYHADHLGSVIGLTNDAGAWVEKYAYTLYGKPAAPSTVGNPYMYTGRRLDTETGLYYYRARYYDPNLRRFIETDPIGYAGGMNLYAYVGNSPINFVDPLGLEPPDRSLWVPFESNVGMLLDAIKNTTQGFGNRIVDFIKEGAAWEAKSGKYVSLSCQIRDFLNDPNFKGKFNLVVRETTRLSGPLLIALKQNGARLWVMTETGLSEIALTLESIPIVIVIIDPQTGLPVGMVPSGRYPGGA
jgi:RHS repeat-associated protein